MFKKLLVLAAASAFSMSASAALVQYDISNVSYANSAYHGFSGYFVQDSNTGGIIWYTLNTMSNVFIPGSDSTIIQVGSYAPNSPTGFVATSHHNGDYNSTLGLSFTPGATPGSFELASNSFESFSYLNGSPVTYQILGGTVTLGTISSSLRAYLESPNNGLTVFTPANAPSDVPEPATLALIAAGLGSIGRMRKRARA